MAPRIETPEVLFEWLEDKPREWVWLIATRAVLRILPLAFVALVPGGSFDAHHRKQVALNTFRAGFVRWAAMFHSLGSDIPSAGSLSLGGDLLRPAGRFAAEAADNLLEGAARDAVTNAARAAQNASDETGSFWAEVRSDAEQLEGGSSELIKQPLWSNEVRGHEQGRYRVNLPTWIRSPLDAFAESDIARNTAWGLWVNWYRSVLPNTEEHTVTSLWGKKIDVEIAFKPFKFWNGDPDDVVSELAKILAGESLEDWLKTQPRAVGVAIAARCALRVLPTLALEFEAESHGTRKAAAEIVLPVFHATAAAWVAGIWPNEITRRCAGPAAAAARNATDIAAASGADAYPAAAAARDAAAAAAYTAAAATRDASVASVAYATRASAATEAFGDALRDDRAVIDRRIDTEGLARIPLWPAIGPEMPPELARPWQTLKSGLVALDEDWEVWTDWYDARLRGEMPWSEFIEIERGRLPEDLWKRGPKAVNAEIKRRLGAAPRDPENPNGLTAPPVEPPAGPGPQYALRHGRLSEEISPPAEGERLQQSDLHRRLTSDARALASRMEQVANRFPELAASARKYAEILDTDIEDVDVTGVWSVGGALASFAQSYREQNAARTLSEPLEPHIAAELQSVVRQHGAFVMGFDEGRDLVHRSDEFAVDHARLAELEASGAPLLDELTTNRDLVDERTRELHSPVRDSVLEFGWGASRVGYSAYLIVRNCVRTMIKLTVGEHPNAAGLIALVMGTSALAGDPNAQFVRAAVPILLQHGRQLLTFFNHSPEMLAYVQWALDLLERDHDAHEKT